MYLPGHVFVSVYVVVRFFGELCTPSYLLSGTSPEKVKKSWVYKISFRNLRVILLPNFLLFGRKVKVLGKQSRRALNDLFSFFLFYAPSSRSYLFELFRTETILL